MTSTLLLILRLRFLRQANNAMSKRLLITIAILTSAFILGLILVWPKYQDFQLVRLKLEQKESELNSKTAYYSKIKNIWGRLADNTDALVKIDSALPQSYSIPVLFNYLQQTANETGLIVENLAFGEAIQGKFKEITVRLEAKGAYFSFKNFFSAIESSERFFIVKSIDLSSPEKEKIISFTLEISAYSY